MEAKTKNRLLGTAIVLCLILVAGLGYSTWHLSQQLNEVKTQSVAQSAFPPVAKGFDPWPDGWDPRTDNWDPSGQFSDLQKQLDDIMNSMSQNNSIFNNSFFNNQGFGFSQSSPRVTLQESPDDYQVVVKVPEGQEVELNTELKGNTLKITGKVKNNVEQKGKGLFGDTRSFNAISASQFSQTMTLGAEVDEEEMTINSGESEITIKIPKKT